jgi:hypothetical protein
LVVEEDFNQDWANKWPHKIASSCYLSVFYKKKEVLQELYVEVDGCRAMLPAPLRNLFVTDNHYRLIKKLNEIAYPVSSFDVYFRRVRFRIIPEEKNIDKTPLS